jgi:hypothetical protein
LHGKLDYILTPQVWLFTPKPTNGRQNGRMRRKSQLWQLRIERSPDLGKSTPLQTAVDILTEHLTSGQFDFQRSQGINYGQYDGTPLTAFPQSRILKPSGLLLLATSPTGMRVPKFNVKAFATGIRHHQRSPTSHLTVVQID